MTRSNRNIVVAATTIALMGGIGLGYWWGRSRPEPPSATITAASADGGPVLYWYDPMVPDQHFDKPGKSPFMDMALVPRYADGASTGGITIAPGVRQSLGVRTVVATRGQLDVGLQVPGTLSWNLREERIVSARVDATVDRLYVRAPFERVHAGQPLVSLIAPAWSTALAEAAAVGQGASAPARALRAAASARLQALGLPAGAKVMSGGRILLTAPVTGVVSEIGVREGQSAPMGTLLFRLNGTDRIWLDAAVPQAGAAGIGAGTLAPGMFAQVTLQPVATAEHPLVPSNALIGSGVQARVIVQDADGTFRPVAVQAGRSSGDRTEILSGLHGGERVVASGQFLIDSEASLSGALERLNNGDAP